MGANEVIKVGAIAAALAVGAAQAAWVSDAAHGVAGVRTLESFPGAVQSLVAAAADPSGRTVAVGSVEQSGARDLLVIRQLADGRLDPSFGFGGMVQIDAGGADDGLAVAVQADGRIVVAGGRNGGALLVRLEVTGAVDQSFGERGFLRVALLNGSAGRLVDVAIDAEDRIVAVGSFAAGSGAQSAAYPFVVRVADGRLDPGFDLDGVRVLREVQARAGALALDAQRRIVVAGYWDAEYRLAALDDAGALATGFGIGGVAKVALDGAALATDLLVHGGALWVSGINGAALVKLGADGALDAAFGVGGVARAAVPINVWALAAMPDGSVGVAGSCKAGTSDGMMIGSFDLKGAFAAVVCQQVSVAGSFAEVRGLVARTGYLHGVAVRFEAGQAEAAVVRYLNKPVPAKCKKPSYRRSHPKVCGR